MIEEPDRAKIDQAMLAYRTFNFAYKALCEGLGLSLTPEEGMKIWKVVEEVAARDTTLNVSAAEMNQVSPTMTAAMQQHNARYANEQTRNEQEIAKMLVDAREGFAPFSARQGKNKGTEYTT